jgi:fatty-acyl-CoA synthase
MSTPRHPYIEDMVEVLQRALDRPVLRHEGTDTTGAELLASTYRYARALSTLGIDRGNLVALYAANRPEALAIRYATHLLGAASVYLSAPPDPDNRAQMLVDFDPSLVVIFPETAHLLPETTAPVATVGPAQDVYLCLDELASVQDPTPLPCRARLDDFAVLLSSGGTTGVPKGSVRDFAAWTAAAAVHSPPSRRQLANGKLAYLTQILVDTTLLGGGTVVLQDEFDPAETLAMIEAERITDLFLVEPQLFELMDHPDVPVRDLGSLHALTHIGDSAAPTLRRRARERLGPIIVHTYGASEVGVVSALSAAEHDPADPSRFTCAGRILPDVEVRFRRTDGTLHPTGGSIEVRSPAMAHGYRRRPLEQATNFLDGWYRSGDLGHLDRQGYLHILGRASDCAQNGGVVVTPIALQDTLCRLSQVRYAAIVFDSDAETRIVAVVPWPDDLIDAAACLDAITAEHGPRISTTVQILTLHKIPLTEQGKPDRPEIRRRARVTRTAVND